MVAGSLGKGVTLTKKVERIRILCRTEMENNMPVDTITSLVKQELGKLGISLKVEPVAATEPNAKPVA